MNFNFDEFKNPVDVTEQFDAGDIEANKGVSCAACFPILFWVPIAASKDSAFGKFYANQGFISLLLCIVAGVIPTILAFIPIIGVILAPLASLALGIATIAVFIFTIYNASQGRARYIPLIGQLIEVFK